MKRLPLLLCLLPLAARPLDPGWPAGPAAAAPARLEVVAETYKRDIEQQTRDSEFTFVGVQNEDRLWLRWHQPLGPAWALSLQVGAAESDGSLDPVPAVGAQAETLLLSSERVSISLFAGAEYVHDIEYRNTGGRIGTLVIADDYRTERHLEYGGGLRWNWRFDPRPGWQVLPYTGLLVTAIRAEGSERYEFPEGVPVRGERRGGDSDVDFSEDGALGALFGLAVQTPLGAGLRVESRLVDRTIYSAGLSWSF
jgi:hypothetical protein